jgi:hypothetical protein
MSSRKNVSATSSENVARRPKATEIHNVRRKDGSY